MNALSFFELGLFLTILATFIKPLGLHIYRVLEDHEATFLDPLLKPIEKGIYRLCSVDASKEQTWKSYLFSLLIFSFVSFLFTSILLSLQPYLPLNSQKFPAPSWDLNLNVAISFMTNTNWQSYAGESTLSYFSQMAALAVQNFTSAAVGLATAAALVRGFSRKGMSTIGNFWKDLTRLILYLFLPLSLIIGTFFLSEGVPQTFKPYQTVETLEGNKQIIPLGPIASQEAIKLLGSNGGGFTNVSSSHPYENPTPLTNFIQLLVIVLIPTAQIYYFGKAVSNPKHAWYILAALAAMFLLGIIVSSSYESLGNPEWQKLAISEGNWEGKESRFGLFSSAFFACTTTAVSCGATNCAHDSLTPIGGMIPLLNIQLSEVIFGGVGAGLYSVLIFVLLAIFISGLIIGRTPEYLGKKIESFDIKMTVLATLSFVLIIHSLTSWASYSGWGLQGIGNLGPHGFSEILYAFSSTASNNGSSFDGLNVSSIPYNLTLALSMLLGRFTVIIPVIALAGSLVKKKIHPQSASSFPVTSFVFTLLLVGVILLVGALTFLPALSMGPILEQFLMLKGRLF